MGQALATTMKEKEPNLHNEELMDAQEDPHVLKAHILDRCLKKAIEIGLLDKGATPDLVTPDIIDEVQEAFDLETLNRAKEMGLLAKDASEKDLTLAIRQKMIDSYLLRDAISEGFLKEGSTTEDLKNDIREKMLNARKLKRYSPLGEEDFTVSPGETVH